MGRSFTEIMDTLPPDQQASIKNRAQTILLETSLQELRKNLGISQAELARLLQVSQASVSKQERQTDMQVSTLCHIIEAMGGELKLTASIPGKGEFSLNQFVACQDN